MRARLLPAKGQAAALVLLLAAAAMLCLVACGGSDGKRISFAEGVTAVAREISSSTSGKWRTYAGKGFTVSLPSLGQR
jgi:hypothetical protein